MHLLRLVDGSPRLGQNQKDAFQMKIGILTFHRAIFDLIKEFFFHFCQFFIFIVTVVQFTLNKLLTFRKV